MFQQKGKGWVSQVTPVDVVVGTSLPNWGRKSDQEMIDSKHVPEGCMIQLTPVDTVGTALPNLCRNDIHQVVSGNTTV